MGVFNVFAFWQISKASCACSNSWPNKKKKLQESTRAHDPFFDEPKIWPSFIFSRFVPVHTFAKLPVHALINKSKKKSYRHQLGPMIHFLTTTKFDLLLYIGEMCLRYTFAKLPVCALITDLKKFDPKKVISVKTHHLAMWPTSLSRPKYLGTSPKLPVHALIHDP